MAVFKEVTVLGYENAPDTLPQGVLCLVNSFVTADLQ